MCRWVICFDWCADGLILRQALEGLLYAYLMLKVSIRV